MLWSLEIWNATLRFPMQYFLRSCYCGEEQECHERVRQHKHGVKRDTKAGHNESHLHAFEHCGAGGFVIVEQVPSVENEVHLQLLRLLQHLLERRERVLSANSIPLFVTQVRISRNHDFKYVPTSIACIPRACYIRTVLPHAVVSNMKHAYVVASFFTRDAISS